MWYMCLKVSSPSVFQKTINHQPTTNNEFVYLRSPFNGRVAEWLGTALQKLLLRFESARDLSKRSPARLGIFSFENYLVIPICRT